MLDEISVNLIYSAAAVYVLAFLSFTFHLASKAGESQVRRWQNIGLSLTWLAGLLNIVGVVLRGVAAGRVPWANMYEFSTTGVAIIVAVFLVVQLFTQIRFLGIFITGFAFFVILLGAIFWYVEVAPLQPALQSYWIVIHVLVAILGTAFFALGAGLSVMQLLQARRYAKAGGIEIDGQAGRLPKALSNPTQLETLAYQLNIIGFVLWTFTLIFGAIWAQKAWGRYWGWDVKEVWTFIIWVIYAGYIHARSTRGWRGNRAAWLSLVGFAAVLFNFGVVNVFFDGLHSYSGIGDD